MVFDCFDNCRPCSGDSRGINFDFLDDFRPVPMEGPGQAVFSPGYQSGGPRIVIMILPEVPSYYSMRNGGPDIGCSRPNQFRSPYDGIPRLILELIERSARSSQGSWQDQSWQDQSWQDRSWQNQLRQGQVRAMRSWQGNWQSGDLQNSWRSDYGMPPALARELARRGQQTRDQAWRNAQPGQTGGRWRADYGVAPGIGNNLADRDMQNKLDAWFLRRSRN